MNLNKKINGIMGIQITLLTVEYSGYTICGMIYFYLFVCHCICLIIHVLYETWKKCIHTFPYMG